MQVFANWSSTVRTYDDFYTDAQCKQVSFNCQIRGRKVVASGISLSVNGAWRVLKRS